MYRTLFLLLIAFQALSFQSIGQKKSLPDWLAAEKKNEKLVYVNGVTIANDTDAEMPTRISVELIGSESKKATFDTFSDRGNFEFFLRPKNELREQQPRLVVLGSHSTYDLLFPRKLQGT